MTGQQVGLFTGPLYTMAKAWTAVAWAESLSARIGRPVVPVFWLQSEDHDLDEIRWTGIRDERGRPVRVQVPDDDRERCSVGARVLPDRVEEALGRVLGNEPQPAVQARLTEAYRPGRSWVDAFVDVMRTCLPHMVFLDPRQPEFRRALLPVHAQAIEQAQALFEGLTRRAQDLRAAGFRVQVPVRADTLSFFHPDGPDGPRYRLRPQGGHFLLAGGTRAVSGADLDDALAGRGVGAFSTSALLRTVAQDRLLDVAACVVGPGELNYWAQVEPLHEAFGLSMPPLVLRGGVRILDARVRRDLDRLGLGEVQGPTLGLEADPARTLDGCLARQGDDVQTLADGLRSALHRALDGALPESDPALASLEGPTRVLRATIDRAVHRYVGKVERLRARSNADVARCVAHLHAQLLPEGVPQERFYGWTWYAARHGGERLNRLLHEALGPVDPSGPVRSVRI